MLFLKWTCSQCGHVNLSKVSGKTVMSINGGQVENGTEYENKNNAGTKRHII